ncbi:Endonuclease IV [Staphylothermus marinus F1]|uniref:Endonuclease IV n=1 Tax=Staphylothermus marinus (strain ATCC 43588 / DSM 3639 / JCM 9404 / F1) TaxID=399550 RepID=A3DNS0_STAMF|nr:TIM barrel protein [Staphylothermus marinus]ABN70280.1 Endonuclease IV [Staphylothermus marinus F1]
MLPVHLGPAGKPLSMKNQKIEVAPRFLKEIGLNAMEYEAVRGVRITREKAYKLGEEARKNDILLSIHAPYFINLASSKNKVIEASISRLIKSIEAASWMNAYIVVFHLGYYGEYNRNEALRKVINSLKQVIEYRNTMGYKRIILGPETAGKKSQIGGLEEIINISSLLDNVRPVIDWAHLHARSNGKLINSIDNVIEVIEIIEKNLGGEAVNPLHSHFSKIEYSSKGEIRHHSLKEKEYGPCFETVCKGLCETGINSVVISESPLLEIDALEMKKICNRICG